jgi:hypothetical protein
MAKKCPLIKSGWRVVNVKGLAGTTRPLKLLLNFREMFAARTISG